MWSPTSTRASRRIRARIFGPSAEIEFFNRIDQNLPFEVTIQIALNPTVNRMAVWVIAQTHIKQLFNTKSAAF